MGVLSKLPHWTQQLIEQPLHFIMGFAPLALVMFYPGWWSGGIAAFVYAVLREIEQRPVRRWWDTILDTAFVTLGGIVAGIVFNYFHG